MKYRIYEYELNGCAKHLMVSLEALEDSDGVTDFIARPDGIKNLEDKGIVFIDADVYLPDYWEGQAIKNKELEWHTIQINKVRGQLNDSVSPVNEIKKPYMMRTVVFNRRIERLKRHEGAFAAKLEESLLIWFNNRY